MESILYVCVLLSTNDGAVWFITQYSKCTIAPLHHRVQCTKRWYIGTMVHLKCIWQGMNPPYHLSADLMASRISARFCSDVP